MQENSIGISHQLKGELPPVPSPGSWSSGEKKKKTPAPSLPRTAIYAACKFFDV
jgi:hypothetical protein